jgi:septum formation protein
MVRVSVPDIDEASGLPAGQAVAELSRKKVMAVSIHKGEIAIAADTLVEIDGRTLGKPSGAAMARTMLEQLSGRWHNVYTGVTVSDGERVLTETEHTRVRFAALSDREIKNYIATGEPMDKAGAYGIQGRGALLVAAIEGDFYNVMGLPLCRLGQLLSNFGVRL